MEYVDLLFIVLVYITAFLYSVVGHGGATGYLALMALFSVAPETMKSTALLLNIFVSGIAFYVHFKKGFFSSSLLFPLIVTSIPLAFVGATIHIDATSYKNILGVFLLLISLRFIFVRPKENEKTNSPKWYYLSFVGGGIGLFSGILGIGGGVFLSPILLTMKWAQMKQTVTISAAFIFLNSLSGLLGMATNSVRVAPHFMLILCVAIVGALSGVYSSITFFSNKIIQYILAIVLFFAGFKIITIL